MSVNGRKVEGLLADIISEKYPKYFIHRFTETRYTPTPADMLVVTKKYNILIEVKATSSKHIKRSNIRKHQIERMQAWNALKSENKSLLALYWEPTKTFALVPLEALENLPSAITQAKAKQHGERKLLIKVSKWKGE